QGAGPSLFATAPAATGPEPPGGSFRLDQPEGRMFRVVSIVFSALACSLAWAQSPVERGSYLVNAVMACDGCHTPRGPGGFLTDQRFSGGSQTWNEPAYTVKGSNITSDRETGIGSWSEADLKRSLVEGVRPTRGPPAPQMPFAFYPVPHSP